MRPHDKAKASLADIEPMESRTGDLVRRIWIAPEHDCWDRCHWDKPTCKPHTGGWHGIGSRRIFWGVTVLGRGAVSWELFAPIYTPTALARASRDLTADWSPSGALDLHFATPPEYLRDWTSPHECSVLEADCWGDVTFLAADEGWNAYVEGGTPGVFAWLGESRLPQVLTPEPDVTDLALEETP